MSDDLYQTYTANQIVELAAVKIPATALSIVSEGHREGALRAGSFRLKRLAAEIDIMRDRLEEIAELIWRLETPERECENCGDPYWPDMDTDQRERYCDNQCAMADKSGDAPKMAINQGVAR